MVRRSHQQLALALPGHSQAIEPILTPTPRAAKRMRDARTGRDRSRARARATAEAARVRTMPTRDSRGRFVSFRFPPSTRRVGTCSAPTAIASPVSLAPKRSRRAHLPRHSLSRARWRDRGGAPRARGLRAPIYWPTWPSWSDTSLCFGTDSISRGHAA